ncbi:MAG TPA: lytic murein transglycosylase [Solirubrobacteraceae bacterium]|nr:lytic murein transglycosylase [Solirubrobacteraceae bacterium]
MPASAASENVVLTLLNGLKIPLLMNVPAGTPLADLKLPAEISPIVGISVTGDPGAAVTSAPAVVPSLPGTGLVPAPTLPATSSVPLVAGGRAQTSTGSKLGKSIAGTVFGAPQSAATAAPVKPQATTFRASDGLPTALNPTLEVAPFDPVGTDVPNFFIDNFEIPPFLLPIYQAAGTEYDVPWQVLAAINEIETNYGRNLSVSSANAEGWMQFLPATWAQYGVDATGSGVKDPDNPADAIFAAARYLHAAGASTSLRGAIFSYNHANWYVDSVLLRAKLIGGMPSSLVNSITGLTQGLFPVAATSRYADDVAETALVKRAAVEQNAALPVTASAAQTATNIYAKAGSPVVAVNDGTVIGMGHSPSLGNYVKLVDAFGNVYYYAGLKRLATFYPVPKATSASSPTVNRALTLPTDPKPTAPASAGHQSAVASAAPSAVTSVTPTATAQATDTVSTNRLFAHPNRPADYAAGGATQVATGSPVNVKSYLTQPYGLKASDLELKSLVKGAHVIAGTILGRIGTTSSVMAPHVTFMIRPAGAGSPLIDPKPILDGWELLQTTAIYRSADKSPLASLTGANPTLGQILLESKTQLQERVLSDPAVTIYSCGRRDIESGQIDQRVLAVLEFLSVQGFKPTVSQLKCGASAASSGGLVSEQAAGDAATISAINGIPILGHQGPGSITDLVIRQLLTLQGTFQPHEIVSTMTYPGSANALAIPTHTSSIQVGFLPQYDANSKLGHEVNAALQPKQWIELISRLGAIANPVVSATPSPFAIPDNTPTGP